MAKFLEENVGMLYTLEDENGVETEFEVLGELEEDDGVKYVALIRYYENPEEALQDNGEFIVLKEEEVDGANEFVTPEDDEYDRVGNLFIEYLTAMDEEEEYDE